MLEALPRLLASCPPSAGRARISVTSMAMGLAGLASSGWQRSCTAPGRSSPRHASPTPPPQPSSWLASSTVDRAIRQATSPSRRYHPATCRDPRFDLVLSTQCPRFAPGAAWQLLALACSGNIENLMDPLPKGVPMSPNVRLTISLGRRGGGGGGRERRSVIVPRQLLVDSGAVGLAVIGLDAALHEVPSRWSSPGR